MNLARLRLSLELHAWRRAGRAARLWWRDDDARARSPALERLAPEARPMRIDAHLDLLRWRGGARFRGDAAMAEALRAALRERRRLQRWDAPIGLLTHHLDHDAAAWTFLDRFLAWSSRQPALS